MSGKVFGKYEVIRRLAVGGIGEIFLARQSGLQGFDRLVILKTLLPELAKEPDAVQAFLDEARIAATLNHPNIVAIYEVGRVEGTYFIAMEYIRGDTIAALITTAIASAELIPFTVAVKLARDAALGLAHAHAATSVEGKPLDIIHRDISPQNVMVREDGVAKVVDFGIARAANRLSRTSTGVVRGKLGYMSPEQVRGEPLDGRADQFALGVVLWELLTMQRRIDKSLDQLTAIHTVIDQDLPPPSNTCPGLPARLDAVVCRMAARDRTARFASCAEVATALQAIIDADREAPSDASDVASLVRRLLGRALQERTADLTPTGEDFVMVLGADAPGSGGAPPPVRRRRRLALAAAVALAVVALAASVVAWRARPPPSAAAEPAPEVAGLAAPEVHITSRPSGAQVRRGAELLGTTPLTTQALAAGAPHQLVVALEGYQDETVTLELAAGEKRTLTLALERSSAGPARPKGRRKAPPPRPAPPPAAAAAPQAASAGYLTVETIPWTRVFVNGKDVGITTVVRFPLPPGKHAIRMINEDADLRREQSVTVRTGEVTKLKLDLR